MLVQRASEANVKLFNERVLKEATDDFDERHILGQGGQGTVYKGVLPDNTTVAIKKALVSEPDEFINEFLLLSKVNQRNVVKMIGCCLESETPLLVYELATNGTLFDHLHGSLLGTSLTWECRLRIAIQVAQSLAYLHSSASVPIIHRDVKSANILLDDKFTAKLADFGTSRLIPMEKRELVTVVKGSLGYLDPEYYDRELVTEKSDVFGYGIVLMELLTGKKAYYSERPRESRNLVDNYVSALKQKRFHEIIDGQVMNETNQSAIQEVARVAVECARATGDERPTMEEVAAVLEALEDKKAKHHWCDEYPEGLIGVQILSEQGETSGENNTS
ncbi:unnamed protein product [Microthlaspi erraticum]|uniref:Protein kinase domain-containing protein n=1 Tax=Microthlaspi erraticum TaxID=1685480 RepID=A0A6D2K4T2_9BRAS|nr:unnamed protein product [Microthlaspi erraticum]